jgi:hypothetical protein
MMRRLALIGVLAASLLSACASHHHGQGYGPSAASPLVFITLKDGGALKPAVAVTPDPLYFRKDQVNVRIVWRLPPDLGLKFADNGIVIEGEITNKPPEGDKAQRVAPNRKQFVDPNQKLFLDSSQTEIVDCRPAENGLEFSCLYRHTRPGVFNYTIRVLSNGKPLDPLDPSIMGP